MSTSTLARRQQEKLMDRIKVLRKMKENRKCFECYSKSPSCVDITHNTFVCMTCGGILRMFNFRVKSISISSFSQPEVEGLEHGGNRNARKKWMSRFPKDANMPTPGNAEQIKEHIRRKYEEDAWVGKAPRTKRRGSGKASKRRATAESESEESCDLEEIAISSKSKSKRTDNRKKTPSSSPGPLQKPVDDLLDLNAMFASDAVVSASPRSASTDMWGFATDAQQASEPVGLVPSQSAPASAAGWGIDSADPTAYGPSSVEWSANRPGPEQAQYGMPPHVQQQQQVPTTRLQEVEDPFAHLSIGRAHSDNPFAPSGGHHDGAPDNTNPFDVGSGAEQVNPFETHEHPQATQQQKHSPAQQQPMLPSYYSQQDPSALHQQPQLSHRQQQLMLSSYYSQQDPSAIQQQQQQQDPQQQQPMQANYYPQQDLSALQQQQMYAEYYKRQMAAQGLGYSQQGYGYPQQQQQQQQYLQQGQGYGYLQTGAQAPPQQQPPPQHSNPNPNPQYGDDNNPFL